MTSQGITTGLVAALAAAAVHPTVVHAQPDPFVAVYDESCSVCHGADLEGAPQGTPLVGIDLGHGDSIAELTRSIAEGFPERGMPGWSETLDAAQIQRLAIYIAERRSELAYTDFKVEAPPVVPDGSIETEAHAFRIETVATGLDPLPYSIAPLRDGRILITEKTQGMRIVSADGELSDLVRGTPQAFDDGFEAPGILLVYGTGYVLDVAPHPDYENNDRIVHAETLIEELGRIRDVETGTDGSIYLLLEHGSGSRIVRLVPEGH